jgi:hypothetical protein
VPLTNSGINSHQETVRRTFLKNGTNYITTQEIVNHYKDDARLNAAYDFYVLQAANGGAGAVPIAPPYYLSSYVYLDIAQYTLYSKWTYPYSIEKTDYDKNGLNPIKTITNYTYSNSDHQLLSNQETINSNGDLLTTQNFYPQDAITGLSASALSAKNGLTTKYIIAPLLMQLTKKNGVLLQTSRVNYKIWPSNLILPKASIPK